jgi:hypothetical protein
MSFPRYPHYKDSGVEWLGAVPGLDFALYDCSNTPAMPLHDAHFGGFFVSRAQESKTK